MDLIEPVLSELSALRKFAKFDFVYTLASANFDQSVPNLATIYLPIRSWMSSFMEQIKPKHLEIFALEFGKIDESDFCLHSSIYKCRPMSTKHCHNIYDSEILDEFIIGQIQQ